MIRKIKLSITVAAQFHLKEAAKLSKERADDVAMYGASMDSTFGSQLSRLSESLHVVQATLLLVLVGSSVEDMRQ